MTTTEIRGLREAGGDRMTGACSWTCTCFTKEVREVGVYPNNKQKEKTEINKSATETSLSFFRRSGCSRVKKPFKDDRQNMALAEKRPTERGYRRQRAGHFVGIARIVIVISKSKSKELCHLQCEDDIDIVQDAVFDALAISQCRESHGWLRPNLR